MVSRPASPSNRPFTFKDALQGFLIHDDLPFASILDSERIREVFRKHKSLFGGIYETSIVLWAFLGQVLRDGVLGSDPVFGLRHSDGVMGSDPVVGLWHFDKLLYVDHVMPTSNRIFWRNRAMARSNGSQVIFRIDDDYRRMVAGLEKTVDRTGREVFTYV